MGTEITDLVLMGVEFFKMLQACLDTEPFFNSEPRIVHHLTPINFISNYFVLVHRNSLTRAQSIFSLFRTSIIV